MLSNGSLLALLRNPDADAMRVGGPRRAAGCVRSGGRGTPLARDDTQSARCSSWVLGAARFGALADATIFRAQSARVASPNHVSESMTGTPLRPAGGSLRAE